MSAGSSVVSVSLPRELALATRECAWQARQSVSRFVQQTLAANPAVQAMLEQPVVPHAE